MALTGYNTSAWANGYHLWLQSDITSQSIENNTSTIRTRVWLYSKPGYNFWGVASTHNLTLNGHNLANNWVTNRSIDMNSYVLVMDSTQTVAHAADGTLTVSAWASFENVYAGYHSVSLSYPANTIPRATTPNVAGGGGFTTGSASTINLPRASSGFTHDVAYNVGTKTGTIATGAGDSTSWTPPDSLATEFTSAAASTVEITVTTKNDATTIGIKKVSFTLTAGAAVVPTVSNVAWSDANTIVASNIGAFIQGRSLIKGVVTAAGVHGSTITSKQVIVAGQTVSENQPIQIFGSGTITASGEATDSRGRSGTKAQNFVVLPYEEPKLGVNGITVQRANASNVADPLGQYLRLDLHVIGKSLKPASTEKNALKIQVFTKPSNGAETARNVINPGLTHNGAVQISGGANFLIANSYNVRVLVTDNAGGTLEIASTVSSGAVALHLADDGVGVGKYHEQGALDVVGDVYAQSFRGTSFMVGDTILAPVGAVFEWYSSTTPAGYLRLEGQAVSRTTYSALFSLWGTTFGSGDGSTTFNLPDRRGRVSVGVSTDTEFNALGKKFGTKTHTLTVAEMPAHNHPPAPGQANIWGWDGGGVGSGAGVWNPNNNGAVTGKTSTGNTGDDVGHNNIQPSIATYFIVRAL